MDEVSGTEENLLSFLTKRRVALYFLMIVIPVLASGYFLNYMYPILAEGYGLSETYIGYSYLLNGLCIMCFS